MKEIRAVVGELRLSHSGQALRMLQDCDECWTFVVRLGCCGQSRKEQAFVLWTALVAPCETPPLAGGASLVVGIVQEQPLGRAAVM